MKNNISFKILPPARYLNSNYYEEEGKKYLLFRPFSVDGEFPTVHFWTKWPSYLLVPDDNSIMVNQINNRQEEDIFTTPLTNLRFKPDFLTYDEASIDGLVIKNTSKIQKIANNQPLHPEFTFKIIKQSGFKEIGEGYKPENKILELEIEPLSLGIEGLPKITKIQFYFFTQDPPHISPKGKQLSKKFYEKLFFNCESKEYAIKITNLTLGNRQTAKIDEPLVCDTLSFSLERDIEEIKEKNLNQENSLASELLQNNKPKKEEKTNETSQNFNEQEAKTQKLIIGGILIIILSLIGLALYYWKKKSAKRK